MDLLYIRDFKQRFWAKEKRNFPGPTRSENQKVNKNIGTDFDKFDSGMNRVFVERFFKQMFL